MKNLYYNIKAFLRNLPLFIKLAWNWRKWDSSYSIDVLVVLIREHAYDQLSDKWHSNNIKRYRQSLTAAALLEQAYATYDHPSMKYLDIKRKYTLDNGRLIIKYSGNKEILDKMHKLAYDKEELTIKARKEFAWDYLNKHIERMWT